MGEWLAQNVLALYGAVVGTVALVLTVARFNYDRRKDNIQLRVTSRCEPDLALRADAEAREKASDPFAGTLLDAYRVTVYNDGHVAAHLADAGVTDSDGNDIRALVPYPHSSALIVVPIGEADFPPISSKSSHTFPVYLRVGQPVPAIKGCFAIDKTGRRWTGRHSDS